MTKIYKKEDCKFVEGRIVCGDEIVAVDRTVFNLFDVLEEGLQKACYLRMQPKEQKAPSLDGFERRTSKVAVMLQEPSTPTVDAMVAQAMDAMREFDAKEAIGDVNKMLEEFRPLVEFVNSEFVVDSPTGTIEQFDLPMIGNPLEVGVKDLARAALAIKKADMHVQGEELETFGLVEVGDVVQPDPAESRDAEAEEEE